MESTPDKETVKTVEITTKNLNYYIKLVDKVVAGFERTDFSFEGSSTSGKTLSNSATCYRELSSERKSESMWIMWLLSSFTNLPPPPRPSATTTLINTEATPSTSKNL